MKSLCFRIPAELYEEVLRGDSREIDEYLNKLEMALNRKLMRMVLEDRRDALMTQTA